MTGCAPVDLPAGTTRLELPAGVLAPYLLRLRSGTSTPVASPGRVVDAGTAKTNGTRTGVRLELDQPARLVLAEGYNRGRRATCDGQDLGEPEIGAAFGTAWRVPATCKVVDIAFGPNRLVLAGYAVSLVAVLVLVAALVWPRRRREDAREEAAAAGGEIARGEVGAGGEGARGGGAAAGGEAARGEASTPRLSARRAALIAIIAGLALGFVFAARATPIFVLLVFVVLYRGIGAKQLAFAGGAILAIAVPILTILIRPENRGGYNPEYSADRIVVHWVAVAGITLLVLALARELSRARARRDRAPDAPPSAAAPPPPAP